MPLIFYVNILLIAIGGALGSVARYLFSLSVQRAAGTLFPVGTFAVNVVGCLAFGAIAGATEQRVQLDPAVRMLLLVGLLGGFTTFSTYAKASCFGFSSARRTTGTAGRSTRPSCSRRASAGSLARR